MAQRLFKKLSPVTAGIAILALGVFSAPAKASVLNFSATTVGQQTVSFALDTSTPYTPPTSGPDSGGFFNAVSDFTLNGTNYGTESLTTTTDNFGTGPLTGFGILTNFNPPTGVGLDFTNLSLISQLSNAPTTYTSSFYEGVVGVFGAETTGGDDFITQINVAAVPEPNFTVPILALCGFAVGFGKRNLIPRG